MDNIISRIIIIIVIGFVLYIFISNKEKFIENQCNHLLVANDVKGKICFGDVFDTAPTSTSLAPTSTSLGPAPTSTSLGPTSTSLGPTSTSLGAATSKMTEYTDGWINHSNTSCKPWGTAKSTNIPSDTNLWRKWSGTDNAKASCNETDGCKAFIYRRTNPGGSVYNDDSQHTGAVYMLKSEITGHSKPGWGGGCYIKPETVQPAPTSLAPTNTNTNTFLDIPVSVIDWTNTLR